MKIRSNKKVTLLIGLSVIFFMVVWPAVGLARDIYPFSRFDMFSQNRFPICGYVILDENKKTIHLNSFNQANLLDRLLPKNNLEKVSHTDSCINIRRQILPTYQKFTIEYFCPTPENILSSNLKPKWSLNCT